MPSANMEFVRSILVAWERGDFASAEWADPEIEYVWADGLAPGSWKGLAGMAEGWRGWLNAWEDFRFDVEEYRELDDERVLVLFKQSARGKRSGLALGEVWTKGAGMFHIRDGKVTRLVGYWERERALTDLGLTSEADSQRS
jgi:ketosteroid isomerase-like protein